MDSVEIQLALYSDMKIPHYAPKVLLWTNSLGFTAIIKSLSSELYLRSENPMRCVMESDNTKVHSNNARARRAQFAAMSSRAINSDKQSKIFGIKN